jgi:hypothetical protein
MSATPVTKTPNASSRLLASAESPDVIGSKAVAIMDAIFEPTALPFDGLQILVRQSYPFLLDALLGLFPISLDGIPIHLNLRTRTGLLESSLRSNSWRRLVKRWALLAPKWRHADETSAV